MKPTHVMTALLALACTLASSGASARTDGICADEGAAQITSAVILTTAPPVFTLSTIACNLSGNRFAEVEELSIRQEAALVLESNRMFSRSYLKTYAAAEGYKTPVDAARAALSAKRGDIAKSLNRFRDERLAER